MPKIQEKINFPTLTTSPLLPKTKLIAEKAIRFFFFVFKAQPNA